MSECVYVCVYICVCVYVCVTVCACVCVCECLYLSASACLCLGRKGKGMGEQDGLTGWIGVQGRWVQVAK